MHHDLEQQPKDIHQHMALAPADFLGAVEAAWATLMRLHRLAVDDGRTRCGIPTRMLTSQFSQTCMQGLPNTVVAPAAKVVLNSLSAND